MLLSDQTLQWLPLFLPIKAKVLTVVFYKVLYDQTPCYLSDFISDYFFSSTPYSSHGSPLIFFGGGVQFGAIMCQRV